MLPAQLSAAQRTFLGKTRVVAHREIDGKSKALLALTVGVAVEVGSLGSTDLVGRRDLAPIFVVVAVVTNDTLVASTGLVPADPGLALAASIYFDLAGTSLAGNTQTEWVDSPIESENAVGDLRSSRPIPLDAGRQGKGH
jgi:hypothetical protein